MERVVLSGRIDKNGCETTTPLLRDALNATLQMNPRNSNIILNNVMSLMDRQVVITSNYT